MPAGTMSGRGRGRHGGQGRRQRTGFVGVVVGGAHPGPPGAHHRHGDRTFAELNANINRLAGPCVPADSRSATASPSCAPIDPSSSRSSWRPSEIGLRLTPINWHLTGEEAGYIVDNCEAKAFVAAASLGDKAVGAAAAAAVGAGKREAGAGVGGLVRLAVGGSLPGFESYEEVIAASEDPSDIDDPVLGTQMLYTSGTTGRPKGVHRSSGRRRAPWPRSTSAATTRTSPTASTPTCAPGRSTTRRRWSSRSPCRCSTGCPS
jgi:long-chain acyl-CoA synthetase